MADKSTVSSQYLMLKDFIQRHTGANPVRANLIGALDTMNYGWERCASMMKTLHSAVQNSPFRTLSQDEKVVLVALNKDLYDDLVARYVVPESTSEDASSSAQITEP